MNRKAHEYDDDAVCRVCGFDAAEASFQRQQLIQALMQSGEDPESATVEADARHPWPVCSDADTYWRAQGRRMMGEQR